MNGGHKQNDKPFFPSWIHEELSIPFLLIAAMPKVAEHALLEYNLNKLYVWKRQWFESKGFSIEGVLHLWQNSLNKVLQYVQFFESVYTDVTHLTHMAFKLFQNLD